jgi:hypothetical protein
MGTKLMQLALCGAIVVFLNKPVTAQEEYYSYHPQSVMTLGAGFSPNNLSAVKIPSCIDYTEKREPGTLKTHFSSAIVRNESQLKQALNIDIRTDASYLTFSGGTTFSYDYSSLFTSDSLSMVIIATSEYGRILLKKADLIQRAQKLIEENKNTEFEDVCGSRYVSMVRIGASVAAIITISDASQDIRSKITAGLRGHGGWGPVSGSVKADFQSELEQASKSGRVDVQVVATGGSGFGSLGPLVKSLSADKDSLKKIQNALGDYLKEFTFENAVSIGFHTSSMTNFGWRQPRERLWTSIRERKLIALTERYREISHRLDEVKGYIREASPIPQPAEEKKLQELNKAAELYETYLDKLEDVHNACKDVRSNNLAACELPSGNLPNEVQILLKITRQPKITFRYQVNDKLLNQDESAVPLGIAGLGFTFFSNYHGALKEIPGGGNQPVLLVEGRFINKIIVQFKPDSGTAETWDTFNFANMSGYRAIYRGWYRDLHVLNRLGYMAANRPAGKGRIYIIVSDDLNRTVRVKAADVDWRRNGAFDEARYAINFEAWTGDHELKPIP